MKSRSAGKLPQKSTRWRWAWSKMHRIKKPTPLQKNQLERGFGIYTGLDVIATMAPVVFRKYYILRLSSNSDLPIA